MSGIVRKYSKLRLLLFTVIIIFITFFGMLKINAYYATTVNATVYVETSTFNDLILDLDADIYPSANNNSTVVLTIDNYNDYNVYYTLSFSNQNVTYLVDGEPLTTYYVNANSSNTKTITITGATGSSITLTLNVSEPYSQTYTEVIYFDNANPTVNDITGGTALKSGSQNLLLKCLDNTEVTAYYFGTTEPTSASNIQTSTNEDLVNLENDGLTKTVNAEGTYWFACRDEAGNFVKKNIVIRKYRVQTVLEKLSGVANTYTSSNYETNGTMATYYIKNGTSLPLTTIYTIPSSSSSEEFKGYTTSAPSSSAATLLTTNPTINSNVTYYMWFNRLIADATFDFNSINNLNLWNYLNYRENFNITYSSSEKMSTVNLVKGSGWEIAHMIFATEAGKTYQIQYDYMNLASYSAGSGYSGIGVQVLSSVTSSNNSGSEIASSYIPTSQNSTVQHGMIEFTATGTTTYLAFNFGMAANGTTISTKVGNVKIVKKLKVGDTISTIPNLTSTEFTFDGYYTAPTGETALVSGTSATSEATYYARWNNSSFVAEMNGRYFTSIESAVSAAPTTSTQINVLRNVGVDLVVIPSNKNIVLNVQNYTLSSNYNTPVITNQGTLELVNANITISVEQSAVYNSGGTLTINNSNITATGSGSALHNEGVATITGNSTLTSAGSGSATIENDSGGTLTIANGTIISTGQSAVQNNGTLTIGVENNSIDNSKPIIRGTTYGINSYVNNAAHPFDFYDGTIYGGTAAVYSVSHIADEEDSAIRVSTTETIDGVSYYKLNHRPASPYVLTIKYHVNGGSIPESTEWRVNNDSLVERSTDGGETWAVVSYNITETTEYLNLWNVSSFGVVKPGYTVVGESAYNTAADGSGVNVNQDNTESNSTNAVTVQRLHNGDLTKNTEVILYINWVPATYTITLNNQSATNAGTTAIYEKYSVGYYLNSAATTEMTTSANGITVPTKTGYTFGGYYTETGGGGTQYIDSSGKLTSSASITNFTAVGTLYAKWTAAIYTVTLNNQSATNAGTTKVYYQYNTTKVIDGVTCYYYTNASLTTCLTNGHTITKPTKTGYTFGGYYTETGGGGTQYVNTSGQFINNIYKTTGNRTLYAKWNANTYQITWNYHESQTYSGGSYLDTGYKVNFGRDFTITAKFKITTANKRYLIIGNYNSNARNLNIEVNTSNKLRLYMSSGDNNYDAAWGTIPTNTDVTVVFTWTASSKAWTISATGSGMTSISKNGTLSAMSGTASKTLRTNLDHRDNPTSTFSNLRIASLTIKDTRTYNATFSDLPSASKSGYTFDGWFTASSGGTKITSSSTVPSANTTYHAQWSETLKFKWRGKCICYDGTTLQHTITSSTTYPTQLDAINACPLNSYQCSDWCTSNGYSYRSWGSCEGFLS